ncbi:MAG: FadR family transcriptional regulator [Paraglaciecola sp.]|uniref:FadR/GntR family transcriptional regulator n=1 Tax=Paraglaciecola sp. TaxID=1920173 RepID=UPI00273D5947|nr:FadR/GntR family transcriptional regulator [Paraglaciecola sp.]MDP5033084.1 FadR family transcriptional regulator [Paraglaciecola sp.]MDP5133508.1 FadR family transcriptional regulator [Paraglaciecola sp.]
MFVPVLPTQRDKSHTHTQRLYLNIADQLSALIQSQNMNPGHRLPAERDLALQFDVSRQTVREALIALEVSGSVEIRPGSGVYVLKSDRIKNSLLLEDAPGPFEIMEARLLIEGEAAALAAQRISNEELLKLKTYLNQMSKLVEQNQIKEAELFDGKFHQLIAHASRNSAIFTMVEWLWALRESSEISRLFTEKVRQHGANPNIKAHEELYQMLSRRDSEGARKVMHEHLSQVTETYALSLAD